MLFRVNVDNAGTIDLTSSIFSAFSNDNIEEAEILQARLKKFADNVTTPYGLAGLKYTVSELGFNGGSVRKPYSDLSGEAREQLRQFLDSF